MKRLDCLKCNPYPLQTFLERDRLRNWSAELPVIDEESSNVLYPFRSRGHVHVFTLRCQR